MNNLTCGFIGLGLIGGSIAKAIKQNNPNIRILAYDIDAETLKLARAQNVADSIYTSLDPVLGNCDYLFLCAPVSKNDDNLKKIKEFIQPRCILTDVGSVKNTIHQTIHELQLEACFIGGHPMTGSEKVGYANSNPLLLENAYYILTPTESVSPEAVQAYKELIASFGSIPLVLDSEQHDYITAAVSHLPHVIASGLVNLVHDHDSSDGLMKLIAAGGFKDITRIASSSPVMWQQICMTNTVNIKQLLQAYISSLQQIYDGLDAQDADILYTLFSNAKDYRDLFLNTSGGPIEKIYDLYLDVPDEAGVIATMATTLAVRGISIKNIGIMHNREFEEGALRIEFYDNAAKNEALALLKEKQYTVYERN